MPINLPNQYWQDHSDWQAREAQAAMDEQRRHPRYYPPTLQERLRMEFTVDEPEKKTDDEEQHDPAE